MATLLCYGALLSYTLALPIPLSASVSYATPSDGPAFNTNYRSTFEIVWSCLTVVFASSWLCVHPNVTGYQTTMWQRLRKRLLLFALAIFSPEFLAIFAFYQWMGCRKLYRSFRGKALSLNIPLENGRLYGSLLGRRTDPRKATWSYTHAQFVQMGGIAFRYAEGDVWFKRPEDWDDEDLRVFFAMKLSEAAISDKSKAGALAKTLVVARVVWFLIQTIARTVQGLPMALLEVFSLAFIAFNIAMYVFWWNKPLDVECPLEIPGTPHERQPMSWVRRIAVAVRNGLLAIVTDIPFGLWGSSARRRRAASTNRIFALLIAVTASSFGAFHTIGWYLPPTQVERTLWRVRGAPRHACRDTTPTES